MPNSKLIGSTGEHYIAYVLSSLGYTPALVSEGLPNIDILASNTVGSRTVAIQVKSTTNAKRKKGRGKDKILHHLEFPLGKKAIEDAVPELIFCFVDLNSLNPQKIPDVYIIPATVFIEHYKDKDKDLSAVKWFRLHWGIEKMEEFKNNWQPIHDRLSDHG